MFFLYVDMLMCFVWIITYTLVFVSTYKTNKAVMPPMACAVIFSWEFAMLSKRIINGISITYAFIGSLGWAIIDFGIIFLIIYKIKWYDAKRRTAYLFFVLTLSILMTYTFTIPKGIFYTSYINTITGVLIWIFYTAKDEYPRTKLNFIILVLKLFADILAWFAYHEYDSVALVLSTLLTLLDLLHIKIFNKNCVKSYRF